MVSVFQFIMKQSYICALIAMMVGVKGNGECAGGMGHTVVWCALLPSVLPPRFVASASHGLRCSQRVLSAGSLLSYLSADFLWWKELSCLASMRGHWTLSGGTGRWSKQM